MRTIIVTIGAPASGKSTWAKNLISKEIDRWKRVNRDDLRLMLNNRPYEPGSHDRESNITHVSDAIVRTSLNQGYDIILDNTNLDGRARKQIHQLAEAVGDVTVIEKVFCAPLKVLLSRDAKRISPVGDDVIMNFAKRYHMDSSTGTFKGIVDRTTYYPNCDFKESPQDESLQHAVICDLDGTAALLNGRNPYDASNCDQDLPNVPVIECVKAMYEQGHSVIFVSGRMDTYREQTIKFIETHFQSKLNQSCAFPEEKAKEPEYQPIKYELHMRRAGDMRKDTIIKREIFEQNIKGKYFIEFVIDDRPVVVRMWRYDLGLTVFQLNDKEF